MGVGVGRSAVSKWLSENAREARGPSLETFAAICRVTGQSADELLGLPIQPPERADKALAGIAEAVAAARVLLLGPAPETPTQDLEMMDRGIRERDARKGTTSPQPRPARVNKR